MIKKSYLAVTLLGLLSITPQMSYNSSTTQTEPKIKLYIYPKCPFCAKVKNFLINHNVADKVTFINANNPKHYAKLKELSHKDVCPYLHDEVHNIKMGESSRIMHYFKQLFHLSYMTFNQLAITLTTLLFVLIFIYFKIVLRQDKQTSKLNVVCTTNMIADAINHIAKDHINLTLLMGPGVDPHLYKPIEQDITKIAQADIIFYNGLHLEARMADLFANMKRNKITIAVCSDIPTSKLIRSEEHDQYFDPHVWFDPNLWALAITTIANILQQYDPSHYDEYEHNKQEYLKKIASMYKQTKQQISSIPKEKRVLITGHDAFEYFARAYDCQVMSLQGISTASEAGTKDIQDLANFIFTHKIPAIFIETSIPPRNIQAVQQNVAAKGFDVIIGKELYSDALGTAGTAEGTYLGMMHYNVNAIVTDLSS